MIRGLVRLAAWTAGWTLFQWWAVIGWPATVEEGGFTLAVMSMGSGAGLVGWYGIQRVGRSWCRGEGQEG